MQVALISYDHEAFDKAMKLIRVWGLTSMGALVLCDSGLLW
jgi:hypothetical protein